MKIRLTNITIEADALSVSGFPIEPDNPLPVDPGPGPSQLPVGWDSDKGVGLYMLVNAMTAAGLTPVGVQDHGDEIIKALKASYPDLDVYLSPSDAPVWPHWGSLDVTVDSGKGGWSFRPDGYTAWVPSVMR